MKARPGPDSFVLRAATLDNVAEILEWRDDGITRAMSRNIAVVSEADAERPGDIAVGWVRCRREDGHGRFDLLAPCTRKVNINLAPAHRPAKIIAEIKPENVPSRGCSRRTAFAASTRSATSTALCCRAAVEEMGAVS